MTFRWYVLNRTSSERMDVGATTALQMVIAHGNSRAEGLSLLNQSSKDNPVVVTKNGELAVYQHQIY